jgi:predicted membrane protein
MEYYNTSLINNTSEDTSLINNTSEEVPDWKHQINHGLGVYVFLTGSMVLFASIVLLLFAVFLILCKTIFLVYEFFADMNSDRKLFKEVEEKDLKDFLEMRKEKKTKIQEEYFRHHVARQR